MLAARWLAEGRDGEALRELASLSGREREINDLWPAALAEVGVHLPLGEPRRVALAWAAGHVVRCDWDARLLVRVLWPPDDDSGDDEELDRLIYTIDDYLDWTERDLRSSDPEVRQRAEAALGGVAAAVAAMAREDLDAAERAFEEWDR